MGANTKIEWADHTFNPWSGCTKVSPACDNCYAATQEDQRYGRVKWGKHGTRHIMSSTWANPLRWNKAAEGTGIRPRVFCASLGDLFEKREELVPHRMRMWQLIEDTPNLDWLLLTKRPGNIAKMMPDGGFGPNVWLGTTVETNEFVKGRIRQLLRVPAAVHFLSCEPLLGPLNLSTYLSELDWVIAGGETGGNSRPTDPAWFRSIRDQAVNAGVAFHFKQWGDWTETRPMKTCKVRTLPSGTKVYRAGKKTAGRLLEGRTWDEVPKSELQPIAIEQLNSETII